MKKYVKKDNKGKVIASTVAFTLLAGVGLMAIPQVNEPVADKLAEHCSPLYQSVVSENAFLKLTIEELQENKTELQDSVIEIDNKLAEEIDEAKIKDLQNQKTAILEKIETLDNRIAELESQQSEYEVVVGEPFKVISFEYINNDTTESSGFAYNEKLNYVGSSIKVIFSNITSITDCQIMKELTVSNNGQILLSHYGVVDKQYRQAETCNISTKIYDATGRLVNISELDDSTEYNITPSFDYTLNDSEQITDFTMTLNLDETVTPAYLNYALQFEGSDASSETQDKYFLYLNHSSLQTEGSFEYVVTNASGEVCEEGIATLEFLDEENRMNIVFVDNITGEQNISTYVMDTYDSIGVSFDFHSDGDNEDITFRLLTDNVNQDTGTESGTDFENPDEEL